MNSIQIQAQIDVVIAQIALQQKQSALQIINLNDRLAKLQEQLAAAQQ